MNSYTAPAIFLSLSMALAASTALATEANRYDETVFVANKAEFKPAAVDDKMINAWGVAIRPAGAGGHFWVTGKDTSFEYVGDVRNSTDESLRVMHKEKLAYVKLPVGGDDKFATGVIYVDTKDGFVITQKIDGAEPITAPAKFMFASDGGIISAWTERKKADGTFDRSPVAETVVDESANGSQFFGLAIDHSYTRIYAANFGLHAGIRVYDKNFKPVAMTFDTPFDTNKNGKVDPGEYAPFNIQALTTPAGENHLFVTYAKTQFCPKEEIEKKTCAKGELFVGEEDTHKPGQGRLAEFTEEGKLVRVWPDAGKLSAPWGLAYAPANFGAVSGKLLVGNFGDGTIAAFDAATHKYVTVMKDAKGKPVKIEKIWGLVFGNGMSLGDADALYFAAGPDDEKNGMFGSLRLAK